MSYAIVGANGRVISGAEAQLAALLAAHQGGSLSGDAFVGAASPFLFSLGGAAPAVNPNSVTAQQARNVLTAMNASSGGNFMSGAAMGASMARAAENRPHVQTVIPGPIREVVQGVYDPVPVGAGQSRTITFNATMIFKPTRLMLGPTMAPVFVIDDLRVSSDSLFLSPGRVPGEVFLPGSVGASALKRRSAQPGTPLSVQVTNIDSAAHVFNAALFGEATDFDGCAG